MADELAANRRNGGYLEKKDFLDRVGRGVPGRSMNKVAPEGSEG